MREKMQDLGGQQLQEADLTSRRLVGKTKNSLKNPSAGEMAGSTERVVT